MKSENLIYGVGSSVAYLMIATIVTNTTPSTVALYHLFIIVAVFLTSVAFIDIVEYIISMEKAPWMLYTTYSFSASCFGVAMLVSYFVMVNSNNFNLTGLAYVMLMVVPHLLLIKCGVPRGLRYDGLDEHLGVYRFKDSSYIATLCVTKRNYRVTKFLAFSEYTSEYIVTGSLRHLKTGETLDVNITADRIITPRMFATTVFRSYGTPNIAF